MSFLPSSLSLQWEFKKWDNEMIKKGNKKKRGATATTCLAGQKWETRANQELPPTTPLFLLSFLDSTHPVSLCRRLVPCLTLCPNWSRAEEACETLQMPRNIQHENQRKIKKKITLFQFEGYSRKFRQQNFFAINIFWWHCFRYGSAIALSR